MGEILEYIMSNYTWLLGGLIIILLAIIGRYADKTNFGQGNKPKEDLNNTLDLDGKKFNDFFEESSNDENINIDNNLKEEQQVTIDDFGNDLPIQQKKELNDEQGINLNTKTDKKDKEIITNDIENNEQTNNDTFEEEFDKFDEEFNSILPKKDIISDELLDDIDNISIEEKNQENNDIPDLDDVELPKIKNLKKDEEDIWKF